MVVQTRNSLNPISRKGYCIPYVSIDIMNFENILDIKKRRKKAFEKIQMLF